MSLRKPNLTIQIQQLPEQCNSKFKGYVEYPNASPEDNHYQQNEEENESRVSRVSHQSNKSNASERSSLLERAEKFMIESRLAKNIKSLSKKKFKTMSNSKVSESEQDQQGYKKTKKQFISRKEMVIKKSKSTNNLNVENSRAKILQEIAEKLSKIENHSQQQHSIGNKSYLTKKKSYRNEINEKNIQKIKQMKQQQEQKQQLCKAKRGKLQHLLEDIKKSNKQAYKVVYTIKKSVNGAAPLQKSLKIQDEDIKANVALTKIRGNNLSEANGILQEVPARYNHHRQSKNEADYSNMSDLRKLTEQLHHVRMELREVKSKNEELLSLSKLNIEKNNESSSQSSRLTKQIQALELDSVSNGSNVVYKNSSYLGTQIEPSFTKPQHYAYYNGTPDQSYVTVRESDLVQACFACGCTCRGKRNIVK